jgi:hypothetical protein
MFFLSRGHRYTKEYIMTELLQYEYWSLELLIFAILFESDILPERAPPDLSFTKEFRFSL